MTAFLKRGAVAALLAIFVTIGVAVPSALALWSAQARANGTAQAGTLSVDIQVAAQLPHEAITYENLTQSRVVTITNTTADTTAPAAQASLSAASSMPSALGDGEVYVFPVSAPVLCRVQGTPAGAAQGNWNDAITVELGELAPASSINVCVRTVYEDWSPLVSESGTLTMPFHMTATLSIHNFQASADAYSTMSTENMYPPITAIDGYLQLELADTDTHCLSTNLLASGSTGTLTGQPCVDRLSYTDETSFTQQFRATPRDDSLRWLTITSPARPTQFLRGPTLGGPALFFTPTDHAVTWWEVLPEADGTFRLSSAGSGGLCLSVKPAVTGASNFGTMQNCSTTDRSQYFRVRNVLPLDGSAHTMQIDIPSDAPDSSENTTPDDVDQLPSSLPDKEETEPELEPEVDEDSAQSGGIETAPDVGVENG